MSHVHRASAGDYLLLRIIPITSVLSAPVFSQVTPLDQLVVYLCLLPFMHIFSYTFNSQYNPTLLRF